MSLWSGLKKVVKSVGKVLKPIAKPLIAAIPGVGPIAAGALTVVEAARAGRARAGPVSMPGGAPLYTTVEQHPDYTATVTRPQMSLTSQYMAGASMVPRVAQGAITAARGAMTPYGIGRIAGRGYSVARQLFRKPTARKAAEAAGWIGIGALWYDPQSGQVVGRRMQRRMNPLNHRALRRAISRVKGAKRICNEVERITRAPARRGRGGSASSSARASCR